MIWFIAQDGKPKQIPEEVLIYKIQNNEIAKETLVVNEILKEWTPLENTDIWKENVPKSDPAHTWRCNKCGNIISEEPCKYCNGSSNSFESSPTSNNPTPAKKQKIHIIPLICIIIGCLIFYNLINANSQKSKNASSVVYHCPHCDSTDVWAGAHNSNTGLQNFRCNYCHCSWADYDNGLRTIYKRDCIYQGKVN